MTLFRIIITDLPLIQTIAATKLTGLNMAIPTLAIFPTTMAVPTRFTSTRRPPSIRQWLCHSTTSSLCGRCRNMEVWVFGEVMVLGLECRNRCRHRRRCHQCHRHIDIIGGRNPYLIICRSNRHRWGMRRGTTYSTTRIQTGV